MRKNLYFTTIVNGKIENQGMFTKISKYKVEGYFFEWVLGQRSDDFNGSSSFLDKCVVHDTDYEMRVFHEKVKNGLIDANEELAKQLIGIGNGSNYTKGKLLEAAKYFKKLNDFELDLFFANIIIVNQW